MNIFRLTTITLSLTILVACGGGGGSGTTVASPTTPSPTTTPPTTGNPTTPPTTTPPTGGGGTPNPLANLANFEASTGHASIQAVQDIANTTNASIEISELFEAGSLTAAASGACARDGSACFVVLPDNTNTVGFEKNNLTDISLIANNRYFSAYSSEVTNGIAIEDITFARGSLTATRMADSIPLEFQTFSGWLDGSVFGTIQITVGASGNEEYRFISYGVGVYTSTAATNPTATGSETTSATWTGATVASIKDTRTFILGDATITVNFTDTDVDLIFDNWRGLDNQELSSMSPITYEGVELTDGRFTLRRNNNNEAFGRFYGTGHTEVGGFFNTATVTGAFGGTRQ